MIIEDKNKLKIKAKSKILVLGFVLLIVLVGFLSPIFGVKNAQAVTCTDSANTIPTGCTPATPPATTALQSNIPSCLSLVSGTLNGCLESIFYTIYYSIPSFILTLSGIFFNTLMALTINSVLFTKSAFIPTAWTVVRDLSNLFFILVLLYIAIELILGLGHDAKKMIVRVIIIALLINFSMFFTEIIIDSSNILALIFYNKINTCTTMPGQSTPTCAPYVPATNGQEIDVSGAMISQFDVSQFLSQSFFDRLKQRGQVVFSASPPSTTSVAIKGVAGIIFPAYGAYSAASNLQAYFNPDGSDVPIGTMLAMIFITGSIMLFAAYCFFVAGISFLSRLIELWILIIFSPFAFMSSTIPILSSVEYLGWDAWFKRLLKVSFMAPIFMFFMYFIFLLIKSNIFTGLIVSDASQTIMATILLTVLPALFILILLLKATKFAKEGSGAIGEALFKGAAMVGGLALGLATSGASTLATGTIGNLASRTASNATLNEKAKQKGLGGMAARMALKTADYGSKASFDVRGVKIAGKSLASATGLNLGEAKVGGYQQRRKETVEKRQKRAKELEVREDEKPKQELNKLEREQQSLLVVSSHEIEQIEKQIKGANANAAAMRAKFGASSTEAKEAGAEVVELRERKKKIKNAKGRDAVAFDADAVAAEAVAATAPADIKLANKALAARAAADVAKASSVGSGRSINELEDYYIPEAQNKIEKENRARKFAYAERLQNRRGGLIGLSKAAARFATGSYLGVGATLGLGAIGHPIIGGAAAAGILAAPFTKEDKRANREAAHKIIMEVKLDSGTKEGSS